MSPPETSGRPQKPDEDVYKKDLAKAEADLKSISDRLDKVKSKIDGTDGNGGSARVRELRKQQDTVREKQASIKASKSKVIEELRVLDDSIKKKVAEALASKKKLPYKSTEDIDARIAEITKLVESGSLRIVEEKKCLQEIGQLARTKKTVLAADLSQTTIDAEKKKADELRQQVHDPESKALAKQYDEIKAELSSLRGDQDVTAKSRQALFDEQNALYTQKRETYAKIKAMKDTYYEAKKAAIAYEREQRQKRYDAQKAERDAYEKSKRLDQAKAKIEEAREPAYEVEITICNNLIRYFDPSAVTEAKSERFAKSFTGGRSLDIRSVESPTDGVVLQSKKAREAEENYFVGGKSKKKGNKNETKKEEKFNLSIGTIQELGTVNVQAPLNSGEVPGTIEKLKQKLSWYKDNQASETEKRVAKAQKEIDALNAAAEKGNQVEAGKSQEQ